MAGIEAAGASALGGSALRVDVAARYGFIDSPVVCSMPTLRQIIAGRQFIFQISGFVFVRNLPILVTGQIAHVLFGRIVRIRVLHTDGAHRHMRHLCGRHRELHITVWRQLFGYLIVARQCHAYNQLMRCVGACSGNEHYYVVMIFMDCNCFEVALRTILVPSKYLMIHVQMCLTLSLFGQSRTTPHNRPVMMFVFGLAGRDFNQRLLQLIDGAQDAFDALDLSGTAMSGLDRTVSERTHNVRRFNKNASTRTTIAQVVHT